MFGLRTGPGETICHYPLVLATQSDPRAPSVSDIYRCLTSRLETSPLRPYAGSPPYLKAGSLSSKADLVYVMAERCKAVFLPIYVHSFSSPHHSHSLLSFAWSSDSLSHYLLNSLRIRSSYQNLDTTPALASQACACIPLAYARCDAFSSLLLRRLLGLLARTTTSIRLRPTLRTQRTNLFSNKSR